MYQITLSGTTLIVSNDDNTSQAHINLSNGASLEKLVLNAKTIISTRGKVPYEKAFASSILFPFPNRLANARYTFDGESYQLPKNFNPEPHAIHGLVYDKTFTIVKTKTSKTEAKIVLRYKETKPIEGFPFKFDLYITYILKPDSLSLEISAENTGDKAFPFAIGWHPYFKTSDLSKSSLVFEAEEAFQNPIGQQELDDCFSLKNTTLKFKTPDYKLQLQTSEDIKFLQLYTPPENRNLIAIEPMTAPADCFNTELGLRVLDVGENFSCTFKISLR